MSSVTFWNKRARGYAKSPIRDTESYETTLARTRSYLSPGDRVLELGCGTGSTALRLADAVSEIVGTDYSEAMIAIARDKATDQGLGNARFLVAGADGDILPETRFDEICAFNLLHLLPGLEDTLTTIANRLPPGGLFISKTPCIRGPGAGFKVRLLLAVLPLMQAVGMAPYVRKLTIAELERAIAAAGFDIIETGSYPRHPPNRYVVARKPA